MKNHISQNKQNLTTLLAFVLVSALALAAVWLHVNGARAIATDYLEDRILHDPAFGVSVLDALSSHGHASTQGGSTAMNDQQDSANKQEYTVHYRAGYYDENGEFVVISSHEKAYAPRESYSAPTFKPTPAPPIGGDVPVQDSDRKLVMQAKNPMAQTDNKARNPLSPTAAEKPIGTLRLRRLNSYHIAHLGNGLSRGRFSCLESF